MPIRIVQSKQNSRLKQLRRALVQPPRQSRRNSAEEPILVGIEGPNLVAEAVRASLHFACVFVAQGYERIVEELAIAPETEILLVPKDLLDSALTTEAPQPVAALVEPPDWTWKHLGNHRTALVVVLAGLQDPGNLGAILRSAEAFGASGVVSLPGTVSAWNPKAVRASAGSVFRLPLLAVDVDECFLEMRETGIRILATTTSGAEPADLVNLAAPVALVIGNEGNGVRLDIAARADGAITIPCPGPVESLNAAVAASVLLYEAARQRSAHSAPLTLRGGAA
jgi:TrmH family RNA methyltransferase